MRWLDKLPWTPLVIVAVFMTVAPINPEPHLSEKLRMLSSGILHKPLDIFDLILHAIPLLLLVMKIGRSLTR